MDLTWRALTHDDVTALVDLRNAAEAVDGFDEHVDETDQIEALRAPGLDLARNSTSAWHDNRLIAYSVVEVPAALADVDRIAPEGTVHPDHRRQGVGRQLLEWGAERAGAAHAARPTQAPGEIHVTTTTTDAGRIALFETSGFEPTRWFFDMMRDLGPPVEPAPVPEGLRLEPFDFGHDDAVRQSRNETFADHWASIDRNPAEWKQWYTGQRAFRPALSFVYLSDDEPNPVAGIALSYEYVADNAATGRRDVWLGQIGVRKRWRGRGAARALLARALEAYRDAGFERAGLDVDSANASGALGLYESAGFVARRTWVSYRRALD